MCRKTPLHTLLPSPCCSRMYPLPFLLLLTLFLTPPMDQTSAKNLLKGLSDRVFIPQFCFSSALIPAREIQDHTYSKHKYFCNLMAPVTASTIIHGQIIHVNARVKTGLGRSKKMWGGCVGGQQRDGFLPAPNPSDCSLPLSAESCLHGWSQVVSSSGPDSLCQRL